MATEAVVIGAGPSCQVVAASPPAWLHQRGQPPRRLDHRPGGPGAVVLDGLAPGTTYDLWVAPAGDRSARVAASGGAAGGWPGARQIIGQVTTLVPPPGRLLTRFATVSDLHIGERRFGFRFKMVEPPEMEGESALRCLDAALDEAAAWGAETIAVRGDLTRNARADQFHQAAESLVATDLPTIGVLGNHDVGHRLAGAPICTAAGFPVTEGVGWRDLPGLRLVTAHTPLDQDHRGDLPPERIAEIAERCAGAPAAAVILHHPLSPRRWGNPYPPGVPVDQSRQLAAALRAANPSTIVLAGHRHRNRRFEVGGITVAESGSTKDYPGCWAGYAVYEGGILQVTRRIADPACLRWTEATARCLGGLWGRWAPGRLEDRCWVQAW